MRQFFSKVSILSLAGLLASTVAYASSAENSHTGADSDNNNDIEVEAEVEQDVENNADINNVGTATVNSGDNDANRNTGGGVIDSGDADIEAELENMVNTLEAYLSGSFGDVDWDLLNEITGSNSDNENTLSVEQEVDLDVENDADLENILALISMSGSNDANRNTGGGEVESGDAMASAEIANHLNMGQGFGAHFGDVDVMASNDTTGADSSNTNDVSVDNDLDIDVDNNADVTNVVQNTSNTGDNRSSRNTGGGQVDTGSATTSAMISNEVNHGSSTEGVHFSDVEIEVSNDTTGADSTNSNNVDVDQDVDVEIDNDADIDNTVTQEASSGGNEASRNTGGGEVNTGNASVQIEISNTVN